MDVLIFCPVGVICTDFQNLFTKLLFIVQFGSNG